MLFSFNESSSQVDWKSGKILKRRLQLDYYNRKCGKQTVLNIIADDAASSCLQSRVVSSGMTKHTAVFSIRQRRVSPSGSSGG